MKTKRGRARRAVTQIISDESFDLYILALTAFIFTILGVTGISSLTDLASLILALLAVLALSQIRSRRHVAAIASARYDAPLSLFATGFPADFAQRRAAAVDLLLIGMTMSRMVQGSSREDMRCLLLRGGTIRVLLLDPSNEELLAQAVCKHRSGLNRQRLRAQILGALEEFISLRDSGSGQLEIRVASSVPSAAISVIDAGSPDGFLVAQHYEHRPSGEASPIISLKRNDGFWFSHFLAEAERMWEDAVPWPLSAEQRLARSPRPAFQEAFGAELEHSLGNARDLLITGIARNALLTGNYAKFEGLLSSGCRMRFLLLDPSADSAISYAADRYYAERSPRILRERIEHSIRLLDELERSTSGELSVRLVSYPLAVGIIAVDSVPALRTGASAAFVEYYTYRTAEEPKITLTPADGRWYSNVLGEAEALWTNAADHRHAESSR